MGLWDNLHERLNEALRETQAEDLSVMKEEEALAKGDDKDTKKLLKRHALVDPNLTASYGGGGYGLYKPRYSHISFKTLKEMSLRDPIIAAIIQTRINQISAFARPQASRYDTGFKIVPKDPDEDVEKGSPEEEEIENLTNYLLNTGIVDEYRDPAEYMNFDTWLKLVVRDRLTYGAAAIETIRDMSGRIHSFLPVPTETIFYANKALSDAYIDQMKDLNKQTYFTGAEKEIQKEIDTERLKRGEYEYVQVIEGRVVEGFTREDLVYRLGNPQNFIDNNGYCIGELEMSTTTITTHLQAENYNKLFFTHGFASRGLLHIKGDVTPAQLQAFRAQWYAQISGNSNSWRTPIIAGVDEVEWVPLSATNREMEYSGYIDHIIRILCSLFQISPLEIGMDYLTKGSGQGSSLSESNNEWKIEESQDRGLRPLLTWVETIINDDILPQASPSLAEKYKFCFVGLDAESREQELERQKAEMELHTNIDDIRKELDKDPVLAGKIILNPNYIEFLLRTHTIGEIREKLLGYPQDAANPLFDYIPDEAYMANRELVLGISSEEEGSEEGPDGEEGPEGGEEGEDGELPAEEGEEGPADIGTPAAGESPEEGVDEEATVEGDGEEASVVEMTPAVEDVVSQYLKKHPEVLEKALVKSPNPKKINTTFDKMKSSYLQAYKSVESQLLKEVLEAVKEEIDGEEDRPDEDKQKN